MNRVVPNGTLRGVEGEGQISPIRSAFQFLKIIYRKYLYNYPIYDIKQLELPLQMEYT